MYVNRIGNDIVFSHLLGEKLDTAKYNKTEMIDSVINVTEGFQTLIETKINNCHKVILGLKQLQQNTDDETKQLADIEKKWYDLQRQINQVNPKTMNLSNLGQEMLDEINKFRQNITDEALLISRKLEELERNLGKSSLNANCYYVT